MCWCVKLQLLDLWFDTHNFNPISSMHFWFEYDFNPLTSTVSLFLIHLSIFLSFSNSNEDMFICPLILGYFFFKSVILFPVLQSTYSFWNIFPRKCWWSFQPNTTQEGKHYKNYFIPNPKVLFFGVPKLIFVYIVLYIVALYPLLMLVQFYSNLTKPTLEGIYKLAWEPCKKREEK